MGTRGMLGFVANGTEKIAYNQFDSYPGGLGVAVALWIEMLKTVGGDSAVAAARQAVIDLVAIDENDEPTADQLALLKARGFALKFQEGDTWYEALREYQGLPSDLLASGFLPASDDFPLDSLFCEWGYLADFDKEVLEIYQGMVTEAHTDGRFGGRGSARRGGYHPIRLVKTFTFDELAEHGAKLVMHFACQSES